jgi:hypothetical protein
MVGPLGRNLGPCLYRRFGRLFVSQDRGKTVRPHKVKKDGGVRDEPWTAQMSQEAKQDYLKRMAAKAFADDLHGRQWGSMGNEEERRHGDMMAKTNRRREPRLARDAAERGGKG